MVIELCVVQFWSEIILVISNQTRAVRSFDFEITRMISDQIALHSVQLPLLIKRIFFFALIYFCHLPGKYLYVEASSPAQDGDKGRLLSNQFPATAGRCLSFWYHMYGSSTGTLNVYILDKDDKSTLVWSKSGEQGDKWIQAKVSLASSLSYQVRRRT